MKQQIGIVILICGLLMAVWTVPVIMDKDTISVEEPKVETGYERSWKPIFEGALGDLDPVQSDNTSILAVWINNHTADGHVNYGNYSGDADGDHLAWQNDSAQFNTSEIIYGYVQASNFAIEIPHSTVFDIIIRVRANTTNAATGSAATDEFNASWVSVNLTVGPGIGGGTTMSFNMTRAVTHNITGDPFIYINFYGNATHGQEWDDSVTTAGAGFQLVRDNRTELPWINLSCFY